MTTPITPSNTPKFPAWIETNRAKGFATWAEEIAHVVAQGYALVPSDYRIPHWSQAASSPKLYVNGADGIREMTGCFNRPASDFGYPLFFKTASQQPTAPTEAPESGRTGGFLAEMQEEMQDREPTPPEAKTGTETPRTNEAECQAAYAHEYGIDLCVSADFARTLERELSEAKRIIERAINAGSSGPIRFREINEYILGLESQFSTLTAERDALAKDKERLLARPESNRTSDEVLALYSVETLRHAANAAWNKLSEAMSCRESHPKQAWEAIWDARELANIIVHDPHSAVKLDAAMLTTQPGAGKAQPEKKP